MLQLGSFRPETPGSSVPPSSAKATTQVGTGPSSCPSPRGSGLQPDSVTRILRAGDRETAVLLRNLVH